MMNIIIGDSRAVALKYKKHQFNQMVVDVWGKPGIGLDGITALIEDNIIYNHPPIYNGKSHYYIVGGICDITTCMKSYKYQEVVFDSNEGKTNEVIEKFTYTAKKIINLGVTPVFCTVFPTHLETWNNLRLKQNKTNILNYHEEYNTMQTDLEKAVKIINKHIIDLNHELNLATPLIHTSMEKNRRNKKYIHYKALTDGCHPGDQMICKIIGSIDRAMSLNKHLH